MAEEVKQIWETMSKRRRHSVGGRVATLRCADCLWAASLLRWKEEEKRRDVKWSEEKRSRECLEVLPTTSCKMFKKLRSIYCTKRSQPSLPTSRDFGLSLYFFLLKPKAVRPANAFSLITFSRILLQEMVGAPWRGHSCTLSFGNLRRCAHTPLPSSASTQLHTALYAGALLWIHFRLSSFFRFDILAKALLMANFNVFRCHPMR